MAVAPVKSNQIPVSLIKYNTDLTQRNWKKKYLNKIRTLFISS